MYWNDKQKRNIRIKIIHSSLKVTVIFYFSFHTPQKCFSFSKRKRNCSQSTIQPCFRNLVWQHLALLQMLVTCLRESWAEIRPTNRWAFGHVLNFDSCCFSALHRINPTALHVKTRIMSATSIFRVLHLKKDPVYKSLLWYHVWTKDPSLMVLTQ